MTKHLFILSSNQWLGEGKIKLNMVDEDLVFFTRWNVAAKDSSGIIDCKQEIQVRGLSEVMINQFIFSEITATSFAIELENQALGKVRGRGVIDENTIGWEFRIEELGFEGFEFYEKAGEMSYLMQAEYTTNDDFRTQIKGKLWLPVQSSIEEKGVYEKK
jgi:hypothetical protein